MPFDNRDITFRMDRIGNPILSKRGEYVANVAKILFGMVPGYDEYQPERGLNIRSKMYKTYTKNTRDADYENEIVKQFTTYTDLIPVNVIAMYLEDRYYVYISFSYQDKIYEMDVNAERDSLSAVLRENARGL